MKLFKILSICAALIVNLQANTLTDVTAAKALSDKAMALAGQGKLSECIDSLREVWPIPKEEIDKLSLLTNRRLLEDYKPRFGEILSAEFVGSKVVGDSLIKYYYILKMERHLTRWQFVYYKPKDEWVLNYVAWDDKTELLFDLIGK